MGYKGELESVLKTISNVDDLANFLLLDWKKDEGEFTARIVKMSGIYTRAKAKLRVGYDGYSIMCKEDIKYLDSWIPIYTDSKNFADGNQKAAAYEFAEWILSKKK